MFKLSLFLAIAGAIAVGGYLYFQLDDEIRRQVEHRLSEFYKDYDVRVSSARFDADKGVAITNLTMTLKAADTSAAPVLSIDEMYLAGKVRMDQLITGKLAIDEIAVRGAKLRMARLADGQWNSHSLLPPPHFGVTKPRLKIEETTATVEFGSGRGARPFELNNVSLLLTPEGGGSVSEPSSYLLAGSMVGLASKSMSVKGQIGCGNGSYDLTLNVVGMELSPELVATLPGAPTGKLHGMDFSGRADLAARLCRASSAAAIGWSASFKVARGRLAHASLPNELTDLDFTGHADPTHLVIDKLSGKFGESAITVAFERHGWGETAPLGLHAKAVGFVLDDRCRSVLPESSARIWDRYRPKGPIDADLSLTFDGETWRPTLLAECRGISLTDAEKFPYVVEQTSGHVEYRPSENGSPDELKLNLQGIGGGRPIRIEVALTHLARPEAEGITTDRGVARSDVPPGGRAYAVGYGGIRRGKSEPHPVGFIKISGNDVPLHEELLAALPPGSQSFVRSLKPQGTIDFVFVAEWKELEQRSATKTQEIRLKDCQINFTRFAYPLQHVHGMVTASNTRWTLHDIEGQGVNATTVVKVAGVADTNDNGFDADLTINARDVPLDETLKLALPPGGQQAWADLNPQGRIDFDAHATKTAEQKDAEIEVAIRPRPRVVSIEPRLFPYRLEQIEGQAFYRRGHLDLLKLSAIHDRTMLGAESGVWEGSPEGGWQLSFSNAHVDRLTFAHDLLSALPPAMQSGIERFQPMGTFGIFGSSMSVAKASPSALLTAAWDMRLECQQGTVQGVIPLRGVNGGVHLVGRCDGRTAVSAGELAIDSLVCKDVQLTNVRGPFWTDSTHVLFGEPASRQQNQPLRRLTADAYGGSVSANIELLRDPNPSYKLDVRLGGASLARFGSERLGGANDLTGTVSGSLVVAGTGQTTQTLNGGGELHVVDGKFYQLPLLISLIKVLNNRPPDTSAFNRCDTKFTIQGENVHFDQLNLLGDALSLYGNGDVKFNHTLDLVFYTLIGPADLPIPLWKTIAGHVSKQGLQLKVVGTLEDYKIERKALPAVNDMLDHIQSQLQEGAATMSPNTASRGPQIPPR